MTPSDGAVSAEGPSTPEDAPDAGLPLEALDRALAPVRRTVAWAVRADPASVRHLEATTRRWVKAALVLDLPASIREQLAGLAATLSEVDRVAPAARHERISALHQQLTRLDAVLGLPLPARRPVPVPVPVAAPAAPAPVPGRPAAPVARAATPAPSEPPAPAPLPPEPSLALAELLPAPLAASLADNGIETVDDLLATRPLDAEVLEPIHGAGRDLPVGRVAVGGRVVARWSVCSPGGTVRPWVSLRGAGPLRARLAATAPPWWYDDLPVDARVVLAGTVTDDGVLDEAELAHDDGNHRVHLARYGLEGLDDAVARGAVGRVLPAVRALRDPLPREILERTGLSPLATATRGVHLEGSEEGRRRLAFDEALVSFLGLARARYQDGRDRGIALAALHTLGTRLARIHDLSLTDDQARALDDIRRDLRQPTPMLRVLAGGVGAGRGIVSLLALLMVCENRAQALFISVDEHAAEVRFQLAEPLLRDMGLVGRMVSGEPTNAIRDAIRRGEVHVAFGGRQLLDASLEFRRLGLVVVEEREHYGRTARVVAQMKTPRPHLLVHTPTPVPTAALLRAYADHDVTLLEPSPVRAPTATVHPAAERERAYAVAAARVAAGEQAIVIFPMVRGQEALDAEDAARVKGSLEASVFPGARVGLFLGAMSREDRVRVYTDFRHRRLDVLISTTYAEDGPTVPHAVVAVVEHADKLDPRRALRIRSLVARPDRVGTCLFITGDAPDPAAVARLERLCASTDDVAFVEAELPYVETSEGDFAVPRFRWLDLPDDGPPARPERDLLFAAHREAHALLAFDPALRRGPGPELLRAVRKGWADLHDDECPFPEPKSTSAPRRRRRRRKK